MSAKGSIPRSFIDELLARADIAEVINQRVPLKKAGATYKACCPFHEEKTPSFNVNPQKQFYHCFGCGASGDALKFIMEYEGLNFVEAVESLASMYGMPVPYEQKSPQAQKQYQQRQEKQANLYDVMLATAKFYRFQLRDSVHAEKAKSYLRDRGLSAEVAKAFYIGFAPPGWDNLIKGMEKQYPNDSNLKPLLAESGMMVVRQEENKVYDRFRDRIMFPIRDGRGRVIAFGGRVLDKEQQPKYLNSPETPIFHKSQTLYGLYEMRQSRQKYEQIFVVEGYMDVVALAQFGIWNAVATLGTAVTAEHMQLLFRQVDQVTICFDGDAAGMKAAWKALELVLPIMEGQRAVKFLFLPDGDDPDSTVRREGLEGFQRRADYALGLSQFLIQGLEGRLSFSVNSVEGRQQLVSLATPFIKLATGLYQYLLVEALAEKVELPTWRLEKQMQVFTGFAKGPKEAAKQKSEASGGRVVTLPMKILRILLEKPDLHQLFYPELLTDIQARQAEDDYFFVQFIGFLQQNSASFSLKDAHFTQFLENWLQQNHFWAKWQQLLNLSVPKSDQAVMAEFSSLVQRLAEEIQASKLGNQGWSDQELLNLVASKKRK